MTWSSTAKAVTSDSMKLFMGSNGGSVGMVPLTGGIISLSCEASCDGLHMGLLYSQRAWSTTEGLSQNGVHPTW